MSLDQALCPDIQAGVNRMRQPMGNNRAFIASEPIGLGSQVPNPALKCSAVDRKCPLMVVTTKNSQSFNEKHGFSLSESLGLSRD